MKKQLLILTALFISVIGYSQITFTDNYIDYEVISNTPPYSVQITNYDFINGSSTVSIPSTVNYNSTNYDVTVIGDEAFLGDPTTGEQITSVIIPSSVTFIGYRSFQRNLLLTVTIPDSVTQLSNLSFAENPLLETVVLSNNITYIANSSFFSCALTSIIIPDNVTSIEQGAFANNQLTSVTIPSNVSSIGIQGFKGNPLTCVISESTTAPTIITPTGANTSTDTFSGSRSNINLSIPIGSINSYVNDAGALWTGFNSVTEGIADDFIVDNIKYHITSATNNTVEVKDYNTAGGTVINIPETVSGGCENFTVTGIGNNAFLNNNITSVTIPDSVIIIGEGAFNYNNINNLVIGVNVEIIGNWAFQSNNLTSVSIPDSVTSISTNAFRFNNITNLVIGNSVETIGDSAFADNDISSLTLPDSLLTIGNYAFVYSDGMANLVIGNSVTSIGDWAFGMNPTASNQLTNITIPSSVTNIGDYAFSIASLTDVTSLATTPPTITTGTNDTFGWIGNRGDINLHIPPNTTGAYVTDAGALWTDFMTVAENALSITDFELLNDIKIITTTGEIKITSSNNVTLQNYALYSTTGAKVTTGNTNKITTNTFANGIYILKLDFNKGTVVRKVVIN